MSAVTFRLFAVRDGHYRTEAEGAIFYRDGEPRSLVENDLHAHEGLCVENVTEALEMAGVGRGEDILLTSTEFLEMRERLAP